MSAAAAAGLGNAQLRETIKCLFEPSIRGLPVIAGSMLLLSIHASSAAPQQDGDVAFLEDQVALFRKEFSFPAGSASSGSTDVWGHGLTRRHTDALSPFGTDKALGVNWRPFHGSGLVVGLSMHRPAGTDSPLESEITWQYGFERRSGGPGEVEFSLSASGSAGVLAPHLSQGLTSTIGVQLGQGAGWLNAQAALSPQVSFDLLAGSWEASIVPEIIAEMDLASSASPFRSVLNVRFGYQLAPNTRPALSAGVQLTISTAI